MPPHWEHVNTEVPYQVRAGRAGCPALRREGTPVTRPPPSFQLIPLHSQTHEYNEVAALFGKTMDRGRIKRIQRIQNLDLWEFFCR